MKLANLYYFDGINPIIVGNNTFYQNYKRYNLFVINAYCNHIERIPVSPPLYRPLFSVLDIQSDGDGYLVKANFGSTKIFIPSIFNEPMFCSNGKECTKYKCIPMSYLDTIYLSASERQNSRIRIVQFPYISDALTWLNKQGLEMIIFCLCTLKCNGFLTEITGIVLLYLLDLIRHDRSNYEKNKLIS